MRFIITLILLTVYSFGFEYHLESYDVSEGVACFFGLYGEAKEENGGRILNTCYIESSDGYIVIDSGPTYSYAQQAYMVMQQRKALPIKYVINTSSVETHILGNQFYKERGATLIGPKSYEQLIEKDETPTLAKILDMDTFVNTRLIPLDIYQNSDSNLTLGDTTIEIKKFEKGDSQHLVVYAPKQKIIFAGEYLYNSRTPLPNHKPKEWSETLTKIKKIGWEKIISSHGIKTKRTALNSTEKYLNRLLAKVETKKIKKQKLKNKKLKIAKQKNAKTKKQRIALVKRVLSKKRVKKHTPNIRYTSFNRAKKEALREHKLIMIKVEASHCKPCEILNKVLAKNENVKKMINKHIKAVKVNTDHASVPMGLSYMGTPTVFLIQPKGDKILMQLEGSMAAKEIEASLRLFVNDNLASL